MKILRYLFSLYKKMPRPSDKIDANTFKKLHDAILQKFEQECKAKGLRVPRASYQIYGYNKFDKNKPHLPLSMARHPKVKAKLDKLNHGIPEHTDAYTSINGKYLYEMDREFKKGKKEQGITLFYLKVYLLYLDCEDLDEFVEKYSVTDLPGTLFQGYYYSFKDHRVKQFSLSIELDSDPDYKVYQKGIHENNPDVIFIGKGKMRSDYFYIDLEGKKPLQDYEIKIIFYKGTYPLNRKKVILCTINTIATDKFPISLYALLVKQEHLKTNQEVRIKRFMMMKRHVFRASNRNYESLDELRYKGNDVDLISHMVGNYRVWRYNKKGDIIQTKMVIYEDFTCKLFLNVYDRDTFNEQVCALDVSKIFDSKLCVSTHPKQGSQIISYAIIDILSAHRFKYTPAYYCSVGLNSEGLMGGPMMMMKEDREDWEPEIIPQKQIENLIGKDAELQIFYGKLNDLFGE